MNDEKFAREICPHCLAKMSVVLEEVPMKGAILTRGHDQNQTHLAGWLESEADVVMLGGLFETFKLLVKRSGLRPCPVDFRFMTIEKIANAHGGKLPTLGQLVEKHGVEKFVNRGRNHEDEDFEDDEQDKAQPAGLSPHITEAIGRAVSLLTGGEFNAKSVQIVELQAPSTEPTSEEGMALNRAVVEEVLTEEYRKLHPDASDEEIAAMVAKSLQDSGIEP